MYIYIFFGGGLKGFFFLIRNICNCIYKIETQDVGRVVTSYQLVWTSWIAEEKSESSLVIILVVFLFGNQM